MAEKERIHLSREESCAKLMDFAEMLVGIRPAHEEPSAEEGAGMYLLLDDYVLDFSGVVIKDIKDEKRSLVGILNVDGVSEESFIIDFSDLSFTQANLTGADFSNVCLSGTELLWTEKQDIKFNLNTLKFADVINRELLVRANPELVMQDKAMLNWLIEEQIFLYEEIEMLADRQHVEKEAEPQHQKNMDFFRQLVARDDDDKEQGHGRGK